jgi:hypothetical protein
MEINFIVTCFDKEDYWPYLKEILNSYKLIKPHVAFCYSGTKEIPFDYRTYNRGKQFGDADLICGGHSTLTGNKVKNWVKISVDSWLCDEQKVINIFEQMEKNDACYAGSFWDDKYHFSTDIMFVRDTKFDFWEKFKDQVYSWLAHDCIEGLAAKLAKESEQYYLIPERSVIPNKYRHACEALGWIMQHDLQKNIDFLERYKNEHFNSNTNAN